MLKYIQQMNILGSLMEKAEYNIPWRTAPCLQMISNTAYDPEKR
jgi:hypothetical protein